MELENIISYLNLFISTETETKLVERSLFSHIGIEKKSTEYISKRMVI